MAKYLYVTCTINNFLLTMTLDLKSMISILSVGGNSIPRCLSLSHMHTHACTHAQYTPPIIYTCFSFLDLFSHDCF